MREIEVQQTLTPNNYLFPLLRDRECRWREGKEQEGQGQGQGKTHFQVVMGKTKLIS